MRNKTAALDLFHDMELPQQKEDPFFSDMESEDEGGSSVILEAASEQLDENSGVPDRESEQQDNEFDFLPMSFLPMAKFPQLTGMAIPVWVFCPGIPLGVPVMAFFPVLICS